MCECVSVCVGCVLGVCWVCVCGCVGVCVCVYVRVRGMRARARVCACEVCACKSPFKCPLPAAAAIVRIRNMGTYVHCAYIPRIIARTPHGNLQTCMHEACKNTKRDPESRERS